MIKSCIHRLRPNAKHLCSRNLSNSPSITIFDTNTKRLQKDKSIDMKDNQKYDYLKDEIAYRLVDRVYDIKRHFPVVVDFGCYKGLISNHLTNEVIDCLICCDTSYKCLQHIPSIDGIETIKLVIDGETLPLKENSIDLVISNLSIHWVNGLPNAFDNIMKCLKEDGVFMGAMFGGQTLFELRSSLQMAELEREGGFGPHISPFISAQDMGALLTRAGYSMITIDTDEIKVNYPTIFELLEDLKGMAENNALIKRKSHLHRDSLLSAAAIYQSLYDQLKENIIPEDQIIKTKDKDMKTRSKGKTVIKTIASHQKKTDTKTNNDGSGGQSKKIKTTVATKGDEATNEGQGKKFYFSVHKIYSGGDEFSFEELMGQRWMKKKKKIDEEFKCQQLEQEVAFLRQQIERLIQQKTNETAAKSEEKPSHDLMPPPPTSADSSGKSFHNSTENPGNATSFMVRELWNGTLMTTQCDNNSKPVTMKAPEENKEKFTIFADTTIVPQKEDKRNKPRDSIAFDYTIALPKNEESFIAKTSCFSTPMADKSRRINFDFNEMPTNANFVGGMTAKLSPIIETSREYNSKSSSSASSGTLSARSGPLRQKMSAYGGSRRVFATKTTDTINN